MRYAPLVLAPFFACLIQLSAQDRFGPPPVDEVGVYYQNESKQWIALPPEIINWKSGGVLKHVGTLGVVKGDINGKIRNGTSKTHLRETVDLLVYVPEGTAIEEYQLIRMHAHSEDREFRTVTGGVFHVSGGTERDTMDFTSEHIARRTWTIHLGDLTPGEYGVMPPGISESRSASAQLGKMYTFSTMEPKKK